MSQENVEIVRQVFEAEARRDPATALGLYHPEVEFDTSRGTFGDVVGSRVYRGIDELRTWFRSWYEAWENVEESVEELIDAGDSVISMVTLRGRGRGSGIELELAHQPAVWTIREGKIVRVEWFRSLAEAREAAELAHRENNMETVRQLAAAVSRRDLRRILELTHPQVEWFPFIAALAEGGHYNGHDGIRRYLSDLDETFETFRTNIEDLLGVGDLVIGAGHIHYCGKGSGVETKAPVGWLLKVRGGKVLRVRAFRDPEKVLEARLSE